MKGETLDQAQALHAEGRLAEAEMLYRQVLHSKPDAVGAIQALGALSYQQGRLDEAAMMFKRGVTLRPDAADFHANLAETLRLLNRFDEAAAHVRQALALDPHLPDAWNSRGLLEYERKRFTDAVAAYREAIRLRPRYVAAFTNLGSALKALGRLDDATDALRTALWIDPDFAPALANLAQVLADTGDLTQLDEAEAICRRAVHVAPRLHQALNSLGNILRLQGRLDEALTCYRQIPQSSRQQATARLNIGRTFQEQGRYADAAQMFDLALAIEPDPARYHACYGSLSSERDDHVEAARHYRLALARDPECAQAHHGLGLALLEQGGHDEAFTCFQQALKIDPSMAGVWVALSRTEAERGDFDSSCRSARSALCIQPQQVGAYCQLATNLRGQVPPAEIREMQELLRQKYLEEGARSLLHFALASVYDAQGLFDEAAALFQTANALQASRKAARGHTYDPDSYARLIDRLVATFTPEFLACREDWADHGPRPVFIVGLPRSGTSLTEQILASHPNVHGAGELPDLDRLLQSVPAVVGQPAADRIDALNMLSAASAQALGRRYVERQNALARRTAVRVVDKMPDNVHLLGVIALLWPGARVIVCSRDRRDVAVSCWQTSFAAIHWASDFEHIARRFADYERLLEHWRLTRPLDWLDVVYEDVVADVEYQARRLIDFVGLEWDPACLQFHSTRRIVRTASMAQVREPVRTSSVGRWKKYQRTLEPLFQALERQGRYEHSRDGA
jgi:tetratricopeptide (TPR) repeat protein